MDETFRVVVEGNRRHLRYFEYDRETGKPIRLDSPKVISTPVRDIYGPYSTKGAARGQGARESRGLADAKVTVERGRTTWEAVE
jgi:hypothetical protein